MCSGMSNVVTFTVVTPTYLLVLVGLRGSHLKCPYLDPHEVSTRVDGRSINNMLWQLVPMLDDLAAEKSVS